MHVRLPPGLDTGGGRKMVLSVVEALVEGPNEDDWGGEGV